ncbi:MAG: hypothetical protein KJP06_09865 [Deltaproteobacteria bacterium]|nr:hypothetical protein [Deltaproteobacteria bacterium]
MNDVRISDRTLKHGAGAVAGVQGLPFGSDTGPTHNFDEDILMARWSHKHLAHLANLGRFGAHCMLITPEGCTGHLGSLVTEADLAVQLSKSGR